MKQFPHSASEIHRGEKQSPTSDVFSFGFLVLRLFKEAKLEILPVLLKEMAKGGGHWGLPKTAITQEKSTKTAIPHRKSIDYRNRIWTCRVIVANALHLAIQSMHSRWH